MTPPVPVLMYHSVSSDPPPSTRALAVAPSQFEAQLRHLQERGFSTPRFGELGDALAGRGSVPARSVVLTFDDGYLDNLDIALPLLHRYGFTATVFVTTGWLADAGEHAAGHPLDRTLTRAGVRRLADAGVEIGAHSHSHPQLDQLRHDALVDELRGSRTLLEDMIAQPIRSLAYPFGYSSRAVRATAVSLGYCYAASVQNRLVPSTPDLFSIPRLTVRRATGLTEFARLVNGDGVRRTFAVDRLLTGGYGVVRVVHRTAMSVRNARSRPLARTGDPEDGTFTEARR